MSERPSDPASVIREALNAALILNGANPMWPLADRALAALVVLQSRAADRAVELDVVLQSRDHYDARVREVEAERDEVREFVEDWGGEARHWLKRAREYEATVARQAETLRDADKLAEAIIAHAGHTEIRDCIEDAMATACNIRAVISRAVLASPEAASAASLPCTRCGATPDEGLNDDCPECQGVVGPEAAATEPTIGCFDCPHPDFCAGMGQCEIGATKLADRAAALPAVDAATPSLEKP